MIKETVISAIISMITHDNGGVFVVRLANVEFRQKKSKKCHPSFISIYLYNQLNIFSIRAPPLKC